LTPIQNENGSIALKNASGKSVLNIEKPYMTDANSKDIFAPSEIYTSYDVGMKIEQKSGSIYTLTLTANKDWLNDPKRAYPVVIDPTFSVTNNSTLDTYVRNQSERTGVDFGDTPR